MFKLMTALSFAAFALAVIGMGAAQSNTRIAGVKFDLPTTAPTIAGAGDQGFRLIVDGTDDYPSPEGDGDDPDIRIPGDPRRS